MPGFPVPPADSLGEATPPDGSDEAGRAADGPGIDQGGPLAQTESAAVLAERRRIARALHDTVSQTLTGTYLQAMITARKLEGSGSEAADDVAHLTKMLHQAVAELRDVVRRLQPGQEPTEP